MGRPYHGYHETLAEKAAALLHGVAKSHGFADGNKRSAFVLTLLMVERSQHSLADDDIRSLEDAVVNLVTNHMSETELVDWFQTRLVYSPD